MPVAPPLAHSLAALLLLLPLAGVQAASITTLPAGTVTARRTNTQPYICVLDTDCAHTCFGEFTISTTAGSSTFYNPTPVAGCTCLSAVGSSTSATFTDGGLASVVVTNDCRVTMTASPGGSPCTNFYSIFPCNSAVPSPPPPASGACVRRTGLWLALLAAALAAGAPL